MLTWGDAIPAASPLAKAAFVTIRSKLIKIAARVIEHVARICVHLPAWRPEHAWFTRAALRLSQAVPWPPMRATLLRPQRVAAMVVFLAGPQDAPGGYARSTASTARQAIPPLMHGSG